MKKKTVAILILTLLLCFSLVSCQNKKGPSTYEVKGDSVSSINELLHGKGGVFASAELPQDVKTSDGEPSETGVYHYKDLPQGGQTIEAYVNELTSSKVGFTIVNGAGKQTEAPDYTKEEGALSLDRPNMDLRNNLQLDISWEKDKSCSIKVHMRDSNKASDDASDGQGASSNEAMTAEDAVNYLKSLAPSQLGLAGKSMKDYNVYYLDGKAVINGVSCLRLRVYEVSPPEGSNAILSTYFLSQDKKTLYRLHPENNEVETLSLS